MFVTSGLTGFPMKEAVVHPDTKDNVQKNFYDCGVFLLDNVTKICDPEGNLKNVRGGDTTRTKIKQSILNHVIDPAVMNEVNASLNLNDVQEIVNDGEDPEVGRTIRVVLRRSHLKCLRPKQWINGDVINYYLSLLRTYVSKEQQAKIKTGRVVILDTWFTQILNNASLLKNPDECDMRMAKMLRTQMLESGVVDDELVT